MDLETASVKNDISAHFVINTIAYVDGSSSDFPDSDDEDSALITKNEKENKKLVCELNKYEITFNKKLYKPFPTVDDCIVPAEPNAEIPCQRSEIKTFMDKLQREGLENTKFGTRDCVSVSIGLNRMLSLSDRENNILKAALNENVQSDIACRVCAYYWKPQWRKKGTNKIVDYEIVRQLYKKVKKVNKEAAETFRKEAESLERCAKEDKPFPPYQHLREYVKNHQNTIELVKKWREKDSKLPVYLSLIDFDTVSFNGIYSSYLEEVKTGKLITVMSTGYEFRKVKLPFIVASQLDRQMKIAKNGCLAGSVYFPEPNMCILIEKDKDTVSESFINTLQSRGRGKESPNLLCDIMQKREDTRFHFFSGNPIITTLPERFKFCRNNNEAELFMKDMSKEFQKGYGTWTEEDQQKFRYFCQSELDLASWWNNISINGCYPPASKAIEVQKHIHDLAYVKDVNVEALKDKYKLSNEEIENLMIAYATYNEVCENTKKMSRCKVESELLKLYKKYNVNVNEFTEDDKMIIPTLKEMDVLNDSKSVFRVLKRVKFTERFSPYALALLVKVHQVGYEISDARKILSENSNYLKFMDTYMDFEQLVAEYFHKASSPYSFVEFFVKKFDLDGDSILEYAQEFDYVRDLTGQESDHEFDSEVDSEYDRCEHLRRILSEVLELPESYDEEEQEYWNEHAESLLDKYC